MSGLLAFGFASPWLLAALVALPVLWWLFRLTPPRPRQQPFPGTGLLKTLLRREEEPVKSPWWLTALRMALATVLILALAAMVWQPDPARDTARGPFWLILDNGWASAPDWALRKSAAERLAAQAAGRDRPIALILTADGPSQPLEAIDPASAVKRLAGAVPRPWAPDRTALLPGLAAAATRAAPGSVAFLADGVAHDDAGFAGGLKAILATAPIAVFTHEDRPVLTLTSFENAAEALTATVRRLAPGPLAAPVRLRALDEKGREIGASPVTFADAALEASATLALPSDLRNEIARLEIAGAETAGAVQLIDDRWRRRRVGLVQGGTIGAEQPLLSPLHYVSRALAPFADLRQPRETDTAAALAALVKERVSAIVLADIGTLPPETASALADWVKAGGVLIRFAGPRLAAGADEDTLIPVPLRQGGRSLGGALSWGQPQPLGDFSGQGPFAALAVPKDVTVARQVLAEPRPDLGSKVWASLGDGTPLVTGRREGNGWLVLFHVTADPAWSNLPLSGGFIEMLRRTVALSAQSGATQAEGDGAVLPPYRLLDGFGHTAATLGEARPLKQAETARTRPGREHPPGLYGNEDGVIALNLMTAATALRPLDLAPLAATPHALKLEGERDLKPWLFGAAILLILADTLAILALAGAFRRRSAGLAGLAGLVILMATLFAPGEVRADPAADAAALRAANGTRLAYILTGNPAVDDISRAGLEGLSRVLAERTALEPAPPQGVDPDRDDLAFFPLIYWPVEPGAPRPPARAIRAIDAYMKSGGTLLFDTRDTLMDLNLRGTAGSSQGNAALRRILDSLDIPGLEPVPETHVLTKAFYILKDFPGRYAGGALWTEAQPALDPALAAERPVRPGDGVSPILITGNDLAGAWAQEKNGDYMLPTIPPDPHQREMAYRAGVNIVMYTLTGNYKADQVHVPALLERLGQ